MEGNILLVDDAQEILDSFGSLLKAAGFDVDVAGGGLIAQKLLRQKDYDVAIVDLAMPDMNGLQLLEWMKSERPQTVAIVMSGSASVTDAAQAVNKGAFNFVVKTGKIREGFCLQIERAVQHKRLSDSHNKLHKELQSANIELENRFAQLELAYDVLHSQAAAIQVDLNRAKQIQTSLLPRELPFSDKMSMSVIYEPAGKIGGDFYDIFKLDPNSIGLYVADTSGHGVSSAMVTMFLKHSVHMLCHGKNSHDVLSPATLLDELNKELMSHTLEGEVFISMIYLILDMNTLEVTFASAGHPPLLVRKQDGEIVPYFLSAPALGLNYKADFSEDTFQLDKDSAMVLFTDGIVMTRNSKKETYGEERLKKVLSETPMNAEELAKSVEKDIRRFGGMNKPDDDRTLLALTLEPQSVPFHEPEVAELEPLSDLDAAGLLTSTENDRVYISITGPGTWQESQRARDLCAKARENKMPVLIDFSHCTRMDSTFLGTLYTITKNMDKCADSDFELQGINQALMREIAELGLNDIFLHCRTEHMHLPSSMHPIEGATPRRAQMGRLLLQSHEALVEADSRNAEKFAAVLGVLHADAKKRHGANEENGQT